MFLSLLNVFVSYMILLHMELLRHKKKDKNIEQVFTPLITLQNLKNSHN